MFDPHAVDQTLCEVRIGNERSALDGCDVVVEFTRPDVVINNLGAWGRAGMHAVVGTSGFDDARMTELEAMWPKGGSRCLVVPNFSIGAVVMQRLAELAAPHFAASEIIELHHDRKADAPSGTALATAQRMAAVSEQQRATESENLVEGATGARVHGIPVHSVRLPGLVAHQEILFGSVGETLRIRHDTTDRSAFVPGVLAAIRGVANLPQSVTIGLDDILGI
ncbi:4-hydroxy-tetrahydrodipicolinate reductase [bacterium BMS3Bbin02]|nr:4-hydroxy-tetrahydrodipicolinate reductase [bacterium BMS3Bbin02]